MNDKVIVSVAAVAPNESSIEPEKIARDVINCAKCGASMVHLHVRGSDGKLTDDLTVTKKIVDLIRKESKDVCLWNWLKLKLQALMWVL